jgi:hypothetical protein
MSQSTLEHRLAALEQQVADLRTRIDTLNHPDQWRSTIGMFAGDEVMKRIFEEGRKIRETERSKARKSKSRRGRRIK